MADDAPPPVPSSAEGAAGTPSNTRPNQVDETVPKVERALEKLSRAKPSSMVEMMAVMGGGMGMMNPLHSKMDGEHISKVLTLASDHDNREFQLAQTKETNATNERRSNRQYVFAAFVLVLVVLVVVMVLFKDHPEILLPVISGLTGLGAGFLAGFGAGKVQGK